MKQQSLIPDCIICFLEGTLSSSYWRDSLKFGTSKAYENGIEYDTVVPWIRAVVNNTQVDQIFYVTYAPWYCHEKISIWLRNNKCREGMICIIGPEGGFGYTKESLLKSEIIRSHTIRFALDNKDFDLYKKYNIDVFPCNDPRFDPKTYIGKYSMKKV